MGLVMPKNKHGKRNIENKKPSSKADAIFSDTFVSMTTPCTIQIYDGTEKNAQQCFQAVKNNTLALEKKYNFHNKNSYLNQLINQRNTHKVAVDKQTYDVLATVKALSIQTQGLFDITMGTLKQCYKNKTLEQVQRCMEKLKPATGLESWQLENGFIHFKSSETLIDLGGVIKEYAVDEGARIVREYGITSAIVNFGGDMHAVGQKPEGENFAVAIKNPHEPDKNLVTIQLNDQALTTSASYERSTKIEGKNFSHILSSQQSIPEQGIISATIISDSTLKSGIYSTSFMISTDIEIPEGLKVVLIDNELQLHQNLQD